MKRDREELSVADIVSKLELPQSVGNEGKSRARLTEYAHTFKTMLGLITNREAYTWQRTTYSLHRQEIQLARAGLHDYCGVIADRLMRERLRLSQQKTK